MKRITTIIIAAGLLLASSWAHVHAKAWEVDANHSVIKFGVKHIFSTVFGDFSDFDGKIIFDPENLAESQFDFTVQVKSINTGIGKRDNHLRSKDFFEAATFPVMRFTSSKITHVQGKNYKVVGEMTLKETTKTMEIPFIFHGTAPNPFDKKITVAGFDTRFTLDRLSFGVGTGKFYDMGVVGKEIDVIISVEAMSGN